MTLSKRQDGNPEESDKDLDPAGGFRCPVEGCENDNPYETIEEWLDHMKNEHEVDGPLGE